MRVLFTTLRNTSHFLPLVPFVDACRRHGHEVAVAAPQDLEPRVAATGATFFPFGHPGDEGLRPIWMRLRGVSADESMRIVVSEIFAGSCARAALPGLQETLKSFRPAIVVRESQEYAVLVASEQLSIPHVRVGIIARKAEAKVFPVALAPLDALSQEAGLPPDPLGERLQREPIITFFPASLDPFATEVGKVQRYRAARKPAAPLPNYWGDRKGPLVYLTLGTVVGGFEEMRSAYRVALDAVSSLPIRVLLTIGNELPFETLGELPANVHVERFVPQDDVLPHAAAIVCHGGSGTVLGALAAGVPMVVLPMFADQPENAERVAAVGAGLALDLGASLGGPMANPASASEIRSALSRVLDEPAFRESALRIATDMAALPAVDTAAIELERLSRSAAQ